MCTAGRRPPTYQLTDPFSRAGLLRLTSGLEQYSDANGVAVLFRVRRRGSAACGREVYPKCADADFRYDHTRALACLACRAAAPRPSSRYIHI